MARDDSFENVKHCFLIWRALVDVQIFKFGLWWLIRKCKTLFRNLSGRRWIFQFCHMAREQSFENVKHYFEICIHVARFSNLQIWQLEVIAKWNVKQKMYNLIYCSCAWAETRFEQFWNLKDDVMTSLIFWKIHESSIEILNAFFQNILKCKWLIFSLNVIIRRRPNTNLLLT